MSHPSFSIPIIVSPSYSFENNWLSWILSSFLKLKKGPLKNQIGQGKKIFREEQKQIWNYVAELGAAETQKMFSDLWRAAWMKHSFSSNHFRELEAAVRSLNHSFKEVSLLCTVMQVLGIILATFWHFLLRDLIYIFLLLS